MIDLGMYVLAVAFSISAISVHYGAKTPDIGDASWWQLLNGVVGLFVALSMFLLIYEDSPLALVAMFELVIIGGWYTRIEKNIWQLDRQRSLHAN